MASFSVPYCSVCTCIFLVQRLLSDTLTYIQQYAKVSTKPKWWRACSSGGKSSVFLVKVSLSGAFKTLLELKNCQQNKSRPIRSDISHYANGPLRELNDCPARSWKVWAFLSCATSSKICFGGLQEFISTVSTADILTCRSRKSTGATNYVNNDGSASISVPLSVSASERARQQSAGTDSAKWNASVIRVINSTCDFPAATSQIACCEKALSWLSLFL